MFWHFILDQIPWWVQLLAIVLFVALPSILILASIFGWAAVLRFLVKWGAPLLGILAAIGLLSRSRQQGYADRKQQEADVDRKVRDEFQDIHRKDEAKSDADLDKSNDPWIRP